MKLALLSFMVLAISALGEIPPVPDSESPDGKLYAVMDVDRDPTISPQWSADEFAKIEITEKNTSKVIVRIDYFGDPWTDKRPLRERIQIKWRSDSKAFAVTINDRFYSHSSVYALNAEGEFVSVAFPSYKEMTGFPPPESKHLRLRGRAMVAGWDKEDRLIYDLFLVPLPSLVSNDPLVHRIYLKVSATKMTSDEVVHETGEWQRGDWVIMKKEEDDVDQSDTVPESKPEPDQNPKSE